MSDGLRAGVVELVVGREEGGEEAWGGPGVAMAMAALVVVLVVGIAAARWRNGRDPLETAWRKLARARGLTRAERREVARLASELGVAPAGLLISPRAMGARAGMSAVVRGLALRLEGGGDRG